MDILKDKIYVRSLIISALLVVMLGFAFLRPQIIASLMLTESHSPIDETIYSDTFNIFLTTDEQAWLDKNPVIKLGVINSFPPFGSINSDNEYVGFHADYKNILEHRLKIKFDIDKTPTWSETLDMAKSGKVDALIGLVNTEERREFLSFTEPYIKNPTVIINDSVRNGFVGSLDKLKGKTVAIEKGAYASTELAKKYPDIKQIQVTNTMEALSLVAHKKADAFVGNAVTANYLIKRFNYNDLFFAGETEYSSNHSIGVNNGKPVLHSILSKALLSIKPETTQAITDYWFGKRVKSKVDHSTIIKLGAVLLLLFGISLAWSLSLRRDQKIIKQSSEHDQLTGLGNRRKFNQLLKKQIKKSNKKYMPFYLLQLNIDSFKEINNNFSHAIGDFMIIEMAKRIKECVPSKCKVTRSSGDGFMIILPEKENSEDIEAIAEQIQNTISQRFLIAGNEIFSSVGIGITRYPDDAMKAEDLLKNVEQAMYHAKNRGKNNYSFFDMEMSRKTTERNNIIRDMRTALAEDQFVLHYQPIVDITTNQVIKAEALVRWNHPTKGLIYPDEFIHIAEETGQIIDIGEWIFKQAVRETVKFCEVLGDDFQMSINTSPLQYGKNGMDVCEWVNHIKDSGLSTQNITLELTEGVLMESKDTTRMNKLYKLRELNVKISIDDFGTGYSSLSYLQKFDIDYLKIDRSFVQDLETNSNNVALVQAMIMIAHKLDCKVIAEGVEDEAQRDILLREGCDFGQGYYYSKPKPAAAFTQVSLDWNNSNTRNQQHLKLA